MAENSKIYEIAELPNGKWEDCCAAHFVRARALVRLVWPTRHRVHFFPDAVVHDGYTEKKNQVDILLRITRGPRSLS
jgi:hypothetical protein